MPFIDSTTPDRCRPGQHPDRVSRAGAFDRLATLAALALLTIGLGGLSGCATSPPSPPPPTPAAPPAPAPVAPPAPKPAARPAADWMAYQREAALKLVRANPELTYLGEVPEPLLAIPVLEVELHADGSVRQINVRRVPGQARDTIDLARQAILRAAPFGAVAHLPKPWVYTEVFLFNDDRRFKPRTLDE